MDYRLRHFLMFVKNFPYQIKRSLEISKFYWNKPDYNWSTIAQLMRFQINKTRLHLNSHNVVYGNDKICRQMLVAEHLLERMLDNDEVYFSNAYLRYPNDDDQQYKFVVYLQE